MDASEYKTLQNLMRYLEISNFYGALDNLLRSMHAFPEVRFRYVVSPKKSLPSTRSPLKFNKKKIREMIKIGYDDAVDAIHEGEGVTVTHLPRPFRQFFESIGPYRQNHEGSDFE